MKKDDNEINAPLKCGLSGPFKNYPLSITESFIYETDV